MAVIDSPYRDQVLEEVGLKDELTKRKGEQG